MDSNRLQDDSFWQCLLDLEALESEATVGELAQAFAVSAEVVREAVDFLGPLGICFQWQKRGEEDLLIPSLPRPRVQVEWRASEWLAVQAHFPFLLSAKECAVSRSMRRALEKVEKQHPKQGLFNNLNHPTLESAAVGSLMKLKKQRGQEKIAATMLTAIAKAVESKRCLEIQDQNGAKLWVFPHLIASFGGHYSLIAEDTEQNSLCCVDIEALREVKFLDRIYGQQFDAVQIKDFLNGLRSLNDQSIRLVLKIPQGVPLPQDHTFFRFANAYVVTNFDGDLIWSANVEPCDDLIPWIESLGEGVEIIGPSDLAQQFRATHSADCKKAA